jgi:hypothetical protein
MGSTNYALVEFLAEPPMDRQIVMRRIKQEWYTNVPRVVINGSPAGFSWGYGGSGPTDFALNIIENLLIAQGYSGATTACWKGRCFLVSYRLRHEFVQTFLVGVSQEEGGVIDTEAVRAWLTEAMNRGPKKASA